MKTSLKIVLLFFAFALLERGTASAFGGEAYPRERLETDWMYQDHGSDISVCFTSSAGHAVERKMVENVLGQLPEKNAALEQVKQTLINAKISGNDPRWKALYFQACEARRKTRLAALHAKLPAILYTKHYNIGGSHYSYTEELSDALHPEQTQEYVQGAKLCRLTINRDGSISSEDLFKTDSGVLRDPDVSYDGKRVVFSKRDSLDQDDFHLYELNLETNQLKQLTFGIGFADYEPCYLPDGNIVFVSTRCGQNVDCWWVDASNMYMVDGDGRFMRRIGFDQVQTNYPRVLDDGSVIYTRWDYNDRGQIYPQPLFVMNYDGTAQTEYYGNNSWFPTAILHARGIPGSQKVIAVASGHHMGQRGKLILIDRNLGNQEATGVQLICPPRTTEAVIVDQYGMEGEQFQYPYPLDETNYLVTYNPEGGPKERLPIPYGIYWMDIQGHRELLAFDPTISCNQPVPLASRSVPPLRPSTVDWTEPTGTFYVQDVYAGPGLQGVPRGTITSLRVVALDYRAAAIGVGANRGPGGVSPNTTPIACRNGSWDVKRVLGSVPVKEDGSAYFEVPARTPVYFQLLDKNGCVVQSMRSWSTLQPNETFGCIGCHENKTATLYNRPQNVGVGEKTTLRNLTQLISPEHGFSFVRNVQPILDKYCVECHIGGKNPDGTDAPMSLLGNSYNPDQEKKHDYYHGYRENLRDYSESYMNLVQEGEPNDIVNWLNVQSIPPMLPPYSFGSAKSKLMTLLDGAHYDVVLSPKEKETLACWIDLAVPFCGSYTESNLWSDRQKAEYDYYMNKRSQMAVWESKNIASLLRKNSGEIVRDNDPLPDIGGRSARERFISDWFARRMTLPINNSTTGQENGYRNVALNPAAAQGEPTSYPHASSNSELGFELQNAAKNVIDGQTNENSASQELRCWEPNRRTDLWLKIEFSRPVDVDKIVMSLRTDLSEDAFWNSAELHFSDGSRESVSLENTAAPQVFSIKKRRTDFLIITNLKQDFPLRRCGLAEVEVWGHELP
ncbi:MAG: DUF7402 domain-containing protein [Thermoguttaceae bacterium]